MKKFLICLTLTCLVALLLFLGILKLQKNKEEIKQTSVKDTPYKTYFKEDSNTILGVEIEGHQYIIFDGLYKGNIIHAEHCPCHDKK